MASNSLTTANTEITNGNSGTGGLADANQLFNTTASTSAERWDIAVDPVPVLVMLPTSSED